MSITATFTVGVQNWAPSAHGQSAGTRIAQRPRARRQPWYTMRWPSRYVGSSLEYGPGPPVARQLVASVRA